MKMRRSASSSDESDAGVLSPFGAIPLEEKYLDAQEEVILLKEEVEELKERIAELEETRLATPEMGSDEQAEEVIRRLRQENRELKVITENMNAESEVRIQQRRYERMLAQRDVYAEGLRANLEREREVRRPPFPFVSSDDEQFS